MAPESQEGQRRELSEGEVSTMHKVVEVFGGLDKMRINLKACIDGSVADPEFDRLILKHTAIWLKNLTDHSYLFILSSGVLGTAYPGLQVNVCDLERNEVDRQGSVIAEKRTYCLEKILELLDLYEETISKAS
jgi:hypothetical protein